MKRGSLLLGGLGLGAGLMYLLDPDRGNRRRSLVRDRFVSWGRSTGDTGSKAWRDLRNRTRGAALDLRGRLRGGEVSDGILTERVRSAMGHLVDNPATIAVEATDGRVRLSGPVLETQADRLLRGIRRVRGVDEVEDGLERHSSAEGVPALQGAGERFAPTGRRWRPATRVAAGAGGAGLLTAAVLRRSPVTAAAGVAGAALLARSIGNRRLGSLAGRGRDAALRFDKTLTIDAAVEDVYSLWSNPESFPRFMSHVREVTPEADGRYTWRVRGPAGTDVEWIAEVSERVPNRLLAWRTLEGSDIRTDGRVRFESISDGRTRISVQLRYVPPAGALGHAAAALFGDDPKSAMDADLNRLKSLLEQGRTTAHHEKVSVEEVLGQLPH